MTMSPFDISVLAFFITLIFSGDIYELFCDIFGALDTSDDDDDFPSAFASGS